MGIEFGSVMMVGAKVADYDFDDEDTRIMQKMGYQEWLEDKGMIMVYPQYDCPVEQCVAGYEITARDMSIHTEMDEMLSEVQFAVTELRYWLRADVPIKLMTVMDVR